MRSITHKRALSYEEKQYKMTHQPLPKLLAELSAPAIVSMMITSIYNMADTFFIGRLGSSSASGAIGVALPLMSIIQAIGFFFGHGSGNYMSRALGSKDEKSAEEMASTGFFLSLGFGLIVTLVGLLVLPKMIFWLGSTDTIAPYAIDYLRYILIGAPWMIGSLVLNNQLRFQGSAAYGMVGIGIGGVLNMALDPLCIFAFGMGVAGAALATIISQMVSFIILLAGTRRGGNIRVRIKRVRVTGHNLREILRGGSPSLCRQGLNSLSVVCLNMAAKPYGDPAITALSIVGRVMMLAVSAVIGFGQGFQPICGYNYGAKRYDRVRGAFWFCVKLSFGLLLVLSVVGLLFAPQIIAVFMAGDNAQVTQIGATALRLQCLLFPLMGYVILSNMMLQTMGLAFRASLLAIARQGLFFIPAILILPPLLGLLGVQMSQTVSDLLSLGLTIPLTSAVLREMKAKETKEEAQES